MLKTSSAYLSPKAEDEGRDNKAAEDDGKRENRRTTVWYEERGAYEREEEDEGKVRYEKL